MPDGFTHFSNQVAGLIISGITVLNRFQCSSSVSLLVGVSSLLRSNSILNFVAIKNNGDTPLVRMRHSDRSSGVFPMLCSIHSFMVSPSVGSFFWSL